jgi:murein DD-endopeptidase MepM/ murein hydrolase activator NlpD
MIALPTYLRSASNDAIAFIMEARRLRQETVKWCLIGYCGAMAAVIIVQPINRAVHGLIGAGVAVADGASDIIPNMGATPKAGAKINGFEVTSPYGKREHPVYGGESLHKGVDLATPTGTQVYAIGKAGEVVQAKCWQDKGGGGLVLTMTSSVLPKGARLQYLHLSECALPHTGEWHKYQAGDIIAATGNSGASTGAHLHIELRKDGEPDSLPIPEGLIWWALKGSKPEPILGTGINDAT